MVRDARAILPVMVVQNAIVLESNVQTSVVMRLNSGATFALKTADTQPINMICVIIIIKFESNYF
jgi:hypothetical protein